MTKITNKQNIQEWSKVPTKVLQAFGDKGDFARQFLLNPSLFKLLGDVKGKKILDAGSGTGYLSRLMAEKGAKVTGIEPAKALFKFAVEKETKETLGITYLQKDLSTFHMPSHFDIVVSNMVFMDIPDFKGAIDGCINSLKKGGTFIFSIAHPCFEMSGKEWRYKGHVIVKEYFEEYATKAEYGYAFHRTLSTYLNFVIEKGCSIEKIIEPKLANELVGDHKEYAKDVHVPSFIIIKAVKR